MRNLLDILRTFTGKILESLGVEDSLCAMNTLNNMIVNILLFSGMLTIGFCVGEIFKKDIARKKLPILFLSGTFDLVVAFCLNSLSVTNELYPFTATLWMIKCLVLLKSWKRLFPKDDPDMANDTKM